MCAQQRVQLDLLEDVTALRAAHRCRIVRPLWCIRRKKKHGVDALLQSTRQLVGDTLHSGEPGRAVAAIDADPHRAATFRERA